MISARWKRFGSERVSKRVRRRLETVTDVREFSSRQVDALLLGFCALLLGAGEPSLTVSPLPQRFQLRRHRLHGLREFGQLSGVIAS